jgi:HK97 family phage portal protein
VRSLASFAPENRSPVPLVERHARGTWFTSSRLKNDYQGQMSAYGSDPVVYPMVRRMAEAVGQAQWQLWTKASSGLREDRTLVTSHPVLDLLARPNKFMTLSQVIEAGQQFSDLTGEINIVVGRMAGVKYPIDLWPIRPDRLVPVPDPYDYLLGWKYELGGEVVPLELNELLRSILPSPLDPYRGMGPLQALMLELDAQRFGKEWQAMFFENSARPGGVIEIDRRLSDPEFNEMRERWSEQHRGLSKAHRVAIIEHGAKWVDTSFSLRDLQMAEMEEVGRDKKLVAFGFPKHMLGIAEDVNRANAEAAEYMFAKWVTRVRLTRWRAMFNAQLLPLFGPEVARRYELDFEDPVPENSDQALAEIETKTQALIDLAAGNFDAVKAAEYLGLPDLGYEKPPPPPVPVIAPSAPGKVPVPDPALTEDWGMASLSAGLDAAMRWEVQGEDDDNACDPCKKNHGKLYRNRQSAYADYPGGNGYIKCVGADYGNKCRCSVKRRRSK